MTLFDVAPLVVSTDLVVDHYRYWLTREWAPELGRAAFVMLNPSTALRDATDPTDTRCHNFTEAWGYGAYSIVNQFAHQATDPTELARVQDPIGPDNDRYLFEVCESADLVVCAWGASVPHYWRHRPRAVVEQLRQRGVRLHHLGLTKDGHPRHPLYLRGDTRPQLWETYPASEGTP